MRAKSVTYRRWSLNVCYDIRPAGAQCGSFFLLLLAFSNGRQVHANDELADEGGWNVTKKTTVEMRERDEELS